MTKPISKRIAKLPTLVYGIAFATVELVIAVWLVLLPALGAVVAGLNISPEVPAMTRCSDISHSEQCWDC